MKKQIFSLLTAICMLVGLVAPCTVMAADTTSSDVKTLLTEEFNYTLDTSISAASNWSINNETQTGGSTAIVKSNPDDSTDKVLDIEVLETQYSKDKNAVLNANLYTTEGVGKREDYLMVSKKVRFTSDANKFVFYVSGRVRTISADDGQKVVDMIQLTYDLADGKFTHLDDPDEVNGSNAYVSVDIANANMPLNKWIDMDFIIDTTAQTYDIYMDKVKINSEPIELCQTVENYKVVGVRYITVGSYKDNKTSGHIYLDDITVKATNNLTSIEKDIDTQRLENIISSLTVYQLTGQKYVSKGFTPNVPGLQSGDSITNITCSDSAVTYNSSTNSVTITQGTEDKIVPVNVTIASAKGSSATKTLNVYIPGDSVVSYYEDMSYPELEGKSIAGASLWNVPNEQKDLTITGTTQFIQKSPDDETDLVLDTNVIRSYTALGNQYAIWEGNAAVAGDATLQANFKFDNTAANQYVWYITGDVKTSSGTTSQRLVELMLMRNENTIKVAKQDGTTETIYETELPTNEWFNVKLKFNQSGSGSKTFDVYLDNVKINSAPVTFRLDIGEGSEITAITKMELGNYRYTAKAGHMYVDDIMVRLDVDDALTAEVEALEIFDTLSCNDVLPVNGACEGTTISWTSVPSGIISAEGEVNQIIGFGETDVKLTATILTGGKSTTKSFDVKLVNTPSYTIDNLTFETSDGEVSYTPVSGSKIKKLSVTKYTAATDDNATAIVAVYDKDGKIVKVSELISVTASGDITLDIQLPSLEDMYAQAFIWNGRTLAPLAYNYRTANVLAAGITVYTIGDSIMQNYGTLAAKQADNTITGWPQVLGLGIDTDKLTIANHALAGRSTRSFYYQGHFQNVLEAIKPGDYLIISFGHNDQKPTDSNELAENKYAPLEEEHRNSTTPAVPDRFKDYKTYEQWLRDYATAVRMKGAYPVFATSIYRRKFSGDTPVNDHCGYPEAMIEVGKEINVPVLDLHSRTGEWLATKGLDGSLKYFVALHDGSDNTHLTYDGAVEVANLAIGEMNRIGLPISVYTTSVPTIDRSTDGE